MKFTPSAILRRTRRAFTLIEIMLCVGLMGLLIGGIFAVQKGAMQVSTELAERQGKAIRLHAFCEMMRRTFEQMPGNARVTLKPVGGAGSGLSEIIFKEYPLAFSWPGASAGYKSVIMRLERSRTGTGMQVALLYLDDEQTQAYDNNQLDEARLTGRLTVFDGIRDLQWLFYKGSRLDTSVEGENEWNEQQKGRPMFAEMYLETTDGSEPETLVFWIPVVAAVQQAPGVPGLPGGGGGGGPTPGAGGPGPGGPGAGGPGRGPGGGRGGEGGGRRGRGGEGGGRNFNPGGGGGPPGGGGPQGGFNGGRGQGGRGGGGRGR